MLHRSVFYVRTVLILALFLGGLTLSPRGALAQETNLLTNPGFEGDYAAFQGDVSRLVAPGWSAWNVARKSGEPSWSNITPQYLPTERQGRVKEGKRAQELYELYAIYTAGVFQQVNVSPGAKLKFSAEISFWSTDLLDQPTPGQVESQKPGAVNAQVGIDPMGGTNGESTSIIWGSSQAGFYDEFRSLSVEATAAGGTITVFVRAITLDPVRRNHTYIDAAVLTAEGGQGTPVVSQPTATNTPTNTPPPTTSSPPTVTPIPPTVTNTPTTDPFIPTREGTVQPTSQTLIPTVPPPTVPVSTPGGGLEFPDLPGRVEYTVQAGDTVSGIAQRFNTRGDAIIELNNLSPEGLIRVGQKLIIPIPTPPTPTRTNTPIPPTAAPPTAIPPTTAPVTPGVGAAPVEVATLTGPTVNGIGTYIMQPGDTL
ncbi:MAG TPA: LysM domain-containing protein, partial [Aggregatilineales bacterium]|nr:LysM domain-containing protein [Aggregatilineales bacterium]